MMNLAQHLASRLPWTTRPLIVAAPMRVLAGPELAVAVSAAGGLGFIGPNTQTQKMRPDLDRASELVHNQKERFAADSKLTQTNSTLPVGVGFQLWADDLGVARDLIAQYKPCVAWLYAPEDEVKDFALWSSDIKQASADTQIWIQIGTLAEVQRLIDSDQVPDAIVVQGAEAGGHGRAEDGIGLTTLVPEVVDLLQEHGLQVPVVAAGGIADGRGAAAAMCLSASGIAMGTRFLASTEARISKGYQQEIVRARDGATNTTQTLLYNHLRGTFGWPKAYAPRTIINRSYLEHKDGKSFEDLKKLHDEASTRGDAGWGPEGRLATYAGASIGLIKDVKDAAHIVRDVRRHVQAVFEAVNVGREAESHL